MKRAAIFSCLGLGDGLISLILSHNLHLNGWQTKTFHPFLSEFQDWFPHLPLAPIPEKVFDEYEKIYLFYEKSSWMQKIQGQCLEMFPEKTCILNPIATPNTDYPFWKNGQFDGNLPFVENLYLFCKNVLSLEKHTRKNGIQPPKDAIWRDNLKRVVIHATSSRSGKNWPQEKYLELADSLKSDGYQPVFILTDEERKEWENLPIEAPRFSSLPTLARYVYESGFMIGNDSGIGHLASCLGIPTLTICRNALTAKFWRPSWTSGEVLFPSPWIPNLKGLRLRDNHWKSFITVTRVKKQFDQLISQA